ncbi:MAG: hypothetical protein Q8O86_05240 [Dehalococcoidia bacterium]|nr:hypothetical protein [Dehalococcoidia bacterium]
MMLKPHPDPIDDPGAWRGMIGQGFTSDREWAAWFASYKAFILRYADLAQAHGVEQFCVGAELLATVQRETEWREVIALVRDRYKGPLTFAADIDREVAKITWWDTLDFIGVDAYPSLTEKNNPSLAELKEALSSNTSIYVSWNSYDS